MLHVSLNYKLCPRLPPSRSLTLSHGDIVLGYKVADTLFQTIYYLYEQMNNCEVTDGPLAVHSDTIVIAKSGTRRCNCVFQTKRAFFFCFLHRMAVPCDPSHEVIRFFFQRSGKIFFFIVSMSLETEALATK